MAPDIPAGTPGLRDPVLSWDLPGVSSRQAVHTFTLMPPKGIDRGWR